MSSVTAPLRKVTRQADEQRMPSAGTASRYSIERRCQVVRPVISRGKNTSLNRIDDPIYTTFEPGYIKLAGGVPPE